MTVEYLRAALLAPGGLDGFHNAHVQTTPRVEPKGVPAATGQGSAANGAGGSRSVPSDCKAVPLEVKGAAAISGPVGSPPLNITSAARKGKLGYGRLLGREFENATGRLTISVDLSGEGGAFEICAIHGSLGSGAGPVRRRGKVGHLRG